MEAKINIAMDNAAFCENSAGQELARILREVANRIEDFSAFQTNIPGDYDLTLRDINGNKVGKFTVK